ncbi:C4-dicarboxylate ABC transporter substrate-binding protein [Catellatospora sp. TT07R-123]|uniref:TAXI family TRAP transporter solute-binding subunit n=1 Tax=Catellatospora sp. TT07R-123 TaxID=2733863 RepID=UPI001B12CB78|nr:TAXI family TRAP transporter solute-binding subunit [Catellatospora sp. TT07R-123]GHJ45597.1 C4-dicarboxylate ABC transporter substrate-binding protein [Catellatospora sp. TT07R-123]
MAPALARRVRRWPALLTAVLVAAVLAACTSTADQGLPPWHNGVLTIGTGPTNGVFNQIGGGYADIVNRHLPGYEALAPPTNGAGENLQRLARGDVDIAFTFADVAADAVAGKGAFEGRPVRLRALARVWNSYTHLVVRADAHVTSVQGLKDLRVATGPRGSGTEEVALRVLAAAGVDPDRDLKRTSASLSQMTNLMREDRLDAMFYTAGLPTVGLTALFGQAPGRFTLVPLGEVLPALNRAHPDIYSAAVIPKAAYGLGRDTATVAVPNLIVVGEDMPIDLAHKLTELIFTYQSELAAVHPEGANIDRAKASETAPLSLHTGAELFYNVS